MSLQKKAISDPATHTKKKTFHAFLILLKRLIFQVADKSPFLVSTDAKESEMMQKPFSK